MQGLEKTLGEVLTISDTELNCLLDCGEGVIDRLSNDQDDGGDDGDDDDDYNGGGGDVGDDDNDDDDGGGGDDDDNKDYDDKNAPDTDLSCLWGGCH